MAWHGAARNGATDDASAGFMGQSYGDISHLPSLLRPFPLVIADIPDNIEADLSGLLFIDPG